MAEPKNVTPFRTPRLQMAAQLRRLADGLSTAASTTDDVFVLTIDTDGIIGLQWMLGPNQGRALQMVGILEITKVQLMESINQGCSCDGEEGDN